MTYQIFVSYSSADIPIPVGGSLMFKSYIDNSGTESSIDSNMTTSNSSNVSMSTSLLHAPMIHTILHQATTDIGRFSVEYATLYNTILDMTNSDDDEIHIDNVVAASANFVAGRLSEWHLPPPDISRHGPASAVFSWNRGELSLYLTITATKLFTLATDTGGIRGKGSFSLVNPISAEAMVSVQEATSK